MFSRVCSGGSLVTTGAASDPYGTGTISLKSYGYDLAEFYDLDPGEYDLVAKTSAIVNGVWAARSVARTLSLTGRPRTLSAGATHTAALGLSPSGATGDDWVWVWGDNQWGQVNATTTWEYPHAIGHRARAVAAGKRTTVLILPDRSVAKWRGGKLIPVAHAYGGQLSSIIDICVFAGRRYALQSGGQLWSWVHNGDADIVQTNIVGLTRTNAIDSSNRRLRLASANPGELLGEPTVASGSKPEGYACLHWPSYEVKDYDEWPDGLRYCVGKRRHVYELRKLGNDRDDQIEEHCFVGTPDVDGILDEHKFWYGMERTGEVDINDFDINKGPPPTLSLDPLTTLLGVRDQTTFAYGNCAPEPCYNNTFQLSSIGQVGLHLTAIDGAMGRGVAIGWSNFDRAPVVLTWGVKEYTWRRSYFQMWDTIKKKRGVLITSYWWYCLFTGTGNFHNPVHVPVLSNKPTVHSLK